jgi:hypothetical protein
LESRCGSLAHGILYAAILRMLRVLLVEAIDQALKDAAFICNFWKSG